jgi:cytochrome b561
MPLRSSLHTWGLAAKSFHWLAAALVLFLLGFGWWMTHMAGRSIRLDMYHLHSVIGYYLGLLLIFRLAWRAVDRTTPPLPADSQPWERWAAQGGHIALYVLMVAVTLSGWLLYSAFPRRAAAMLFGLIPVPFLLSAPDRAIAGPMEGIHKFLSYALLAVVVVHVGAALRHHFVKRNDVLRRMWAG